MPIANDPSIASELSPERAPGFSLPASDGVNVSLDAQLGAGPVVLAFYRGHWCPYCCRYLAKLQGNIARFIEAGAKLLAISPEPPATSAELSRRLGLTYPLLSDVTGKVIGQYGTRNGFASSRSLLPHPAIFVIDPIGMIRFRSIDRNYKKRTTMRAIFEEIQKVLAATDR